MIFRTLAVALAFGMLSIGLAKADEPRTINDCEKIQAADAYNQCLAKFGPTSKLRNMEPERAGDIKASSADAAATAKPLSRGRQRAHRGGGRKRAHFTISHRRHR